MSMSKDEIDARLEAACTGVSVSVEDREIIARMAHDAARDAMVRSVRDQGEFISRAELDAEIAHDPDGDAASTAARWAADNEKLGVAAMAAIQIMQRAGIDERAYKNDDGTYKEQFGEIVDRVKSRMVDTYTGAVPVAPAAPERDAGPGYDC